MAADTSVTVTATAPTSVGKILMAQHSFRASCCRHWCHGGRDTSTPSSRRMRPRVHDGRQVWRSITVVRAAATSAATAAMIRSWRRPVRCESRSAAEALLDGRVLLAADIIDEVVRRQRVGRAIEFHRDKRLALGEQQ
jgi:hypothetical protein